MDRKKVRDDFRGLANDLISIRRDLSRQIKQESKTVRGLEIHVKALRKSVIRLQKRKKTVEQSIRSLSEIRNTLSFVTFENVEMPTLSSSSDSESDNPCTQGKDQNQVSVIGYF